MRLTVVGSYAKALVMTVDRLPGPGETLLGQEYRETFGGKGSDMAVQAARLGAEVTYVGAVGDDAHGAEFRALLAAEGVDGTRVTVDPTAPTGVGFIVKDTAGRNLIVVDKGANDRLSPEVLDASADVLRAADVVLAQLEIPLGSALHGLAVARSAGVATVLNPAPAVDLRGVDLSAVDVLTPNEHEARVALGLPPSDPTPVAELARRLRALGPRAVVVTCGGAGAVVVDDAGSTAVPPVAVDVVDSNGAGDSFNAALAVALGEGQDLAAAAGFANAVAALCCEGWETVPSYRTREDVEAFLGGSGVQAGTIETEESA
ncbi:ribokinase [Krasilnikoviella flava]|uniref:Ribokinase n=1 Tax=Krasilnikoviella flava TaxID=526729 RepID=A0A1T5KUC3_9MICO|nr:ribokinase [Krasilnikoviella flava]SKC66818.1 ribokinase [Krasilnikoviella flava]